MSSTDALDRARDLHRRGHHSAAVKVARSLIEQIGFGTHVVDRDPQITRLDAQTLLADAYFELGEHALAQTEFDNVLRRTGVDRSGLLRLLAGVDDLEQAQNIAYGQIKQVEVAASLLDPPSHVTERSHHAQQVAWVMLERMRAVNPERFDPETSAILELVDAFASHQRARALRLAGWLEDAISLWQATAATIARLLRVAPFNVGYPAERAMIEAALTLAVLGEDLSLDIAEPLNPWDRAALHHLSGDQGLVQNAAPELHDIDSGELRRTRTAAWFDALPDPSNDDVDLLLVALANAPPAAKLYYPWHSSLRRLRAGHEVPPRLRVHLDSRLRHLTRMVPANFHVPRNTHEILEPESIRALARIISL